MTPDTLISLVGLSFTIIVSLLAGVVWLVRLEGKNTAVTTATEVVAASLAAHIKAQADTMNAHTNLSNDMGKEVVRLQEQVKHFGAQIDRLTKAIEEMGHPNVSRPRRPNTET